MEAFDGGAVWRFAKRDLARILVQYLLSTKFKDDIAPRTIVSLWRLGADRWQ
jgi:hypothetical protein